MDKQEFRKEGNKYLPGWMRDQEPGDTRLAWFLFALIFLAIVIFQPFRP